MFVHPQNFCCLFLPSRHDGTMKKTILFLGLIAAVLAVGSVRTLAYDHDSHGWWDAHHHHHPFIYHNHHRGYWDERGGTRIFINV